MQSEQRKVETTFSMREMLNKMLHHDPGLPLTHRYVLMSGLNIHCSSMPLLGFQQRNGAQQSIDELRWDILVAIS